MSPFGKLRVTLAAADFNHPCVRGMKSLKDVVDQRALNRTH
jgi:hypothetical protein